MAAQYKQQDEDVLTYALFPQVATDFFKYREAQQTKGDEPAAADTKNGGIPGMILGSNMLTKADRACTKRIWSLDPPKHEAAAICVSINQRIRMFLELRQMRSSGAIRKYHVSKEQSAKGLLDKQGSLF